MKLQHPANRDTLNKAKNNELINTIVGIPNFQILGLFYFPQMSHTFSQLLQPNLVPGKKKKGKDMSKNK